MREIKTGKPLSEQENDSLQTYLSEIGKENLLSEQEEQELSAKIQNGDESAIEKLTTANLRFVVSIAKRYQDRGLGINDLISEGNFGLIKAARKFDAAKGQRFVQYAVHFIQQAIENAIQEQSGIYTLPHSMDDPVELKQSKAFSVDAPLVQGKTASLLHVLSDPNAVIPDKPYLDDVLRQGLIRSLSVLNDRERRVVSMFYGLNDQNAGLTYEEIGTQLGLKRERVRDIRKKAERKMKKYTKNDQLKSYLK